MSYKTIASKMLLALLLAAPAFPDGPKVEQEGRGELEDSGVNAAREARLVELGYESTPDSLLSAVVQGDLEAVEILLHLGQSPNAAQDENQLMVIAAERCQAEPKDKRTSILKALLGAGGDPNTKDANKMVPLIWAASYCDAEAVQALLEAGAEVDPDVGGNIGPLAAAKSAKRREIVAILKKAGAKEN